MVNLNYKQLPIRVRYLVNLFLLDKASLLKTSGKDWCHCCGEQFMKHTLCSSQKCHLCCQINCLDNQNYYHTQQHAPPLTEDDLVRMLDHLKLF